MVEPESFALSGGDTFQGGGKPWPIVAGIRSDGTLIAAAEEDHTLVDVKPPDTEGIFGLPADR